MGQHIQVANGLPSRRDLLGTATMVRQKMKEWEARRGLQPIDSAHLRRERNARRRLLLSLS